MSASFVGRSAKPSYRPRGDERESAVGEGPCAVRAEPLDRVSRAAAPGFAHDFGNVRVFERKRFALCATVRRNDIPAAERDAGGAPSVASTPGTMQGAAVPQRSGNVAAQVEGASIRLPDILLPGTETETDACNAVLTYNPSVTETDTPDAGDFGTTRPYTMTLSNIVVTPAPGQFAISATLDNPITCAVAASTGPAGQVDIESDSDSDITMSNYRTVVSDLTPNPADLSGRSPRTRFWAHDLSLTHELFHAHDGETHCRTGIAAAQTWLNAQTAARVDEVNVLLNQVPGRVASTRRAAMTAPGREQRAYADGAPQYLARANAVKAKGDAGQYPQFSRAAKVGIGMGSGALLGAGIGAFGGPAGALIGAGVGALVGGIAGAFL